MFFAFLVTGLCEWKCTLVLILSESQSFWNPFVLFERMRTPINQAFVVKAFFIGLISPEDGFRIVSPRIRVFDDEEKSVVQLLDSGCFLGY